MNKSKSLTNFFLTVIITLSLMLLSLVRSENFSWPDAVHTSYGFPLFWLTHQVSSIAGPADLWHVHPMDLTVNLLFWIGIASLILWYYNKFRKRIKV